MTLTLVEADRERKNPSPIEAIDSAAQAKMAFMRRQRLQAAVARLLREHQKEVRHWQDQLLHLSAVLLIDRARLDWGLISGVPARPLWPSPQPAPWGVAQTPLAHAVICRTGCVMDDDHWLEGDQCRRTGQACDSGQERQR